jgi:NADH dehydrogenase
MRDSAQPGHRHRVVIVGGGFGGMQAVSGLARAPVDVTLIDERNYHLFQPLLYQVATASLSPSEIAWPIRFLVRARREIRTVLATVTGVDVNARDVILGDGTRIAYDTLVLGTGARHAYFGHPDWEAFAPGLKTLDDATTVRRRILLAFERAEAEPDPRARAAFLTFVVVGGGPTGVELAGAVIELARSAAPDFRTIDTKAARVVLVEAGARVLAEFDQNLSAYAQRALERLGVEVVLHHPVTNCDAESVTFGDQRLATRTIVWAAGVRASPAAEWLGVPADRSGRIKINPDLTVPGRPEIFAIGDTVSIAGPEGKPVPGIAPAAKQQGGYVARVIANRLAGRGALPPFKYRHEGSLATIGKRLAVIDFGRIKLRGTLAWWVWGFAHIYFLIGLRNRLSVAVSWLWVYLRDQRGGRLITRGGDRHDTSET